MRSGRTQRRIMSNCAPELGGTERGIQHKNTRLTCSRTKYTAVSNLEYISIDVLENTSIFSKALILILGFIIITTFFLL